METKVNDSAMERYWQRLGFHLGVFVSAIGLSGGICFFWKNNVNFEVDLLTANCISGMVSMVNSDEAWYFCGIYGPSIEEEKSAFWDVMEQHVLSMDCPWLCIGDLNLIKNASEKDGGRKFSSTKVCILTKFLDSIGVLFMWQNNRDQASFVCEKLDRDICSPSWLLKYPKSGV